MPTQVVNFLWLNLECPAPADPDDGSIRRPVPARYVQSLRRMSARHPKADMVLWVDRKRLTDKQWAYLEHVVEKGRKNIQVKDLRTIPDYVENPMFDQAETNPNWRDRGQTSLIWLQVDVAKVLISLQGNYDQTFFTDLDHADNLDINTKQIQHALKKHGLFFSLTGMHSVENNLWGFTPERRKFFEEHYADALQCAGWGDNAWHALDLKVGHELIPEGGGSTGAIPEEEICIWVPGDGSQAKHTGSSFRNGSGREAKLSIITGAQLDRIFNQNSAKSSKSAASPTRQRPQRATAVSASPA